MNFKVKIDMECKEEFSSPIYETGPPEKSKGPYLSPRNNAAIQPICLTVTDEEQLGMGGITSELYWNWIEINDCWVYEKYRGYGIRSQLLQTVEKMARKRGADYSMHTTFEPGTRDFYVEKGYKVVGEFKEYLPGVNFYTLKKSL
ncbi:GNAT family N-acetyltransferase [Halobacillus sp. A1]|uniref:GNAT family N-acetyltransferase n=1 Tax=Halobacillus sp. A1 TaxID=2880262 RepID=UPI0020A6D197|nr:GNAT family N-acetyltransferase [Halobacillus sp. A1]